jgi:hypothetical protein
VLHAGYVAGGKLAGIVESQLRGLSPPKEGPLQHIDQWGRNVAMAWVKGFQSAGIGDVVGDVLTGASRQPVVAASPARVAPALTGPLPPMELHFHSVVPYTPAQAQQLAAVAGPEMVRWMRRHKVL